MTQLMPLRKFIAVDNVVDSEQGEGFLDNDYGIHMPYIRNILSEHERRLSCCNLKLPLTFERAAEGSILDPTFDTTILESQYCSSVFPHIRSRYRYAMLYIILSCLSWLIYFFLRDGLSNIMVKISLGCVMCVSTIALKLTWTSIYRQYQNVIGIVTSLGLIAISLFLLLMTCLSPLGHFVVSMEIILIIYTAMPLKLWQNISIAMFYSILFEVVSSIRPMLYYEKDVENSYYITIRCLIHLSVHFLGFQILIMNMVRMRGTFMKVGQNLLDKRQLEMERQLKEKMIHSVMPPKVADMLLQEATPETPNPVVKKKKRIERNILRINSGYHRTPRLSSDVKSLFRPFHMHSMDNVSILFADIVGFTNMSSTKTAEQLVEILNDLFERFDDLCAIKGCEKISTLGDCYYCVSGCPEPREDHAYCCVEMGLGMISAMRAFDVQRHEGVKMRVGVHTGSVLCGIVGTKRVKFDVWSNDVTFANKMESTGRPEKVHISEETKNFLNDNYELQPGDDIEGHKTYFVTGRKHSYFALSESNKIDEVSSLMENDQLLKLNCDSRGVKMSRSVVNLSVNNEKFPSGPASLNPSPILLSRVPHIRVDGTGDSPEPFDPLSANTIPKITATQSLPNHLDDENTKIDVPIAKPSTGFVSRLKNLKSLKLRRRTEGHCTVQNPKNLNKSIQICTVATENTLLVPTGVQGRISPFSLPSDDLSSSGGINSVHKYDEIIDIRSYLTQSRSDISPFDRSNSYKSQNSRNISDTPEDDMGIKPSLRPRSSTTSCHTFLSANQPLQKTSNNIYSSATSRKDSGIRSNSRRSSDQPFYLHQPSDQRVSGYYTSNSSISTAAKTAEPVTSMAQEEAEPRMTANAIQQLRKQSDLQLIRCVRDNARSQPVKPPISYVTLFFKSHDMEKSFRKKAHRFNVDVSLDGPETLATPRYNTFIDVFVQLFILVCVNVSLILLTVENPTICLYITIGLFLIFGGIQFCVLVLFGKNICMHSSELRRHKKPSVIFDFLSSWYPWHFLMLIFMSLPTISLLTTCAIRDFSNALSIEYHYGLLLCLCILSYCNFTQLNCWSRNVFAVLSAILFILIFANIKLSDSISTREAILNETSMTNNTELFQTNTTRAEDSTTIHSLTDWIYMYRTEIYFDVTLLLLLVWFINREFEICYRSSFFGNEVAKQDKIKVQKMKNHADLLLHNIIPKHVAEQLKNTAKYSENHHCVAIIFASIVNFNEMYDETYLGGKEYLRVLNELIGDFDELLSRNEFRSVDKIKTIGSTFMAASGLDPSMRNENKHLYELMDFAITMQEVVESFNKDLLEFNLVLRIGYNIGDVTAGVIGTSKLHYDIWGDAVNVASRMDSTGVAGRVQIGKDCLPYLEDRYDFEPRGQVYVKGKNHMEVFLLKGLKKIVETNSHITANNN